MRDRWFQILLIAIGFFFGSAGTYFWQWKETDVRRNTIVKVMRIGIKREVLTSKQVVNELNEEKTKPGQLAPHGFKFLHDPSIYFPAVENIGILSEEIVIALDAYYRSLKSCQAMRDFMYEELERLNENVTLANDSINVYIHQLNRLTETGEAALEVINEKYPQTDTEVIRKEFLPKVETYILKQIK